MKFFALTPETAEKFFKMSIEKEAVTIEERLKILAELKEEVLLTGDLDPKTSEALDAYFKATNHKGIIGIRKDQPNE